MDSRAPRWLYLHGFASGPGSYKGVAVERHYAAKGIHVERLNLRVPSMEHLRVTAMIDVVRAAIGDPRDRALLFGSSLGGYVASRVAERDPRVSALVLLAPAFRLFERWRERLGEHGYDQWRRAGWLEIDDHAEKKKGRVDFGFAEDAERFEAENGVWPDVRVPTLIVHGKHDETVSIDVSRAFAANKPNVRLIETDDGHELVQSLPVLLAEADKHLAGFFAGSVSVH